MPSNRAEIFLAAGVGHKAQWRDKTWLRADEFLESLGYLKGKPTITVP